jgi:hypothetical protein
MRRWLDGETKDGDAPDCEEMAENADDERSGCEEER